MKLMMLVLLLFFADCAVGKGNNHKPEQGIFVANITRIDTNATFFKTLYQNTSITVNYTVSNCNSASPMKLNITVIGTNCKGLFRNDEQRLKRCLNDQAECLKGTEHEAKHLVQEQNVKCGEKQTVSFGDGNWIDLKQATTTTTTSKPSTTTTTTTTTTSKPSTTTTTTTTTTSKLSTTTTTTTPTTSKPSTTTTTTTTTTSKPSTTTTTTTTTTSKPSNTTTTTTTTTNKPSTTTTIKPTNASSENNKSGARKRRESPHKDDFTTTSDPAAFVPFIGEYVIVFQLSNHDKLAEAFSIKVVTAMESPVGYLSADEYPLMTFYLVMCVVYILYSLAWIIMSLCNCRDLLRVQYWIGGVIVLGLIEKAVHFAEYYQVNETGLSNSQMEKFAGFVACFKRTLSRMLVIIVSLGFGIVKPRLGPKLYQVLGVGCIYFIVALLIKMFEIDVYYSSNSREGWLLMFVPLLIIDLFILYWVLRSLMQTLKTLRLRRNTDKLSLYRHFTNVIVLCALVSLAMSIYILYYHELGCSENFASDWFETACWPLVFSIILLVIMVLWRPSKNNKRYAYSPLVDGNDSEDEVEIPMLGNGATESMKSRGGKSSENIPVDINMMDENLKWIDENIPPTIADTALPVLMDPIDIKKATKYEMSKMD